MMRQNFPSIQRNSRHARGFTLIELLIVMVIIGIVATILLGFFIGAYRKTQLRDGAVQILTDVRQIRSQAQRTSVNSTATLSGSVGAPALTYSLTMAGTTTTKTLLAPISVAPYTGYGKTVTYSAPYGELSGSGVIWEVSSSVTSDKLYVKTVGVTGKAVLSATP